MKSTKTQGREWQTTSVSLPWEPHEQYEEDEMVGCITDSMDMSLSRLQELWWTGKPDVLQSLGPQRLGHDWATELYKTHCV